MTIKSISFFSLVCVSSLILGCEQNIQDVNMSRLQQEYQNAKDKADLALTKQMAACNILFSTEKGKVYKQALNNRNCIQDRNSEAFKNAIALLDSATKDLVVTDDYKIFVPVDNEFAYHAFKRNGLEKMITYAEVRPSYIARNKAMIEGLTSALYIDISSITKEREDIREKVFQELLKLIDEVVTYNSK